MFFRKLFEKKQSVEAKKINPPIQESQHEKIQPLKYVTIESWQPGSQHTHSSRSAREFEYLDPNSKLDRIRLSSPRG